MIVLKLNRDRNSPLFIFLGYLSLVFLVSCKSGPAEFVEFEPITDFDVENGVVSLDMDLEDAVVHGVRIPTASQTEDGRFTFRFRVKDLPEDTLYYYKVYYQNSSYKYPQTHPLAHENFYGSWEDVEIGFKQIPLAPGQSGEVQDGFCIVGNPRNELKYFGGADEEMYITVDAISELEERLRATPDWLASVQKKANERGRSLDEQIYLDALWSVTNAKKEPVHNNRWKRNPRVGNYEFMLVVLDQYALDTLPEPIRHVNSRGEQGYQNPFGYFLYGPGANVKGITVLKPEVVLQTRAHMDVTKGVFFNFHSYRGKRPTLPPREGSCSDDFSLFEQAHFEEFFHNIDEHFHTVNIDVAADVHGNDYSQSDYLRGLTELPKVKGRMQSSNAPCTDVGYESEDSSIFLSIPGNSKRPFKKQNAGIKTRIGFTYGKVRGKVKFPTLLNDEGVWNGLTCAFWMFSQSDNQWNERRPCQNGGFLPKGEVGEEKRITSTSYSEIDIEIVKTSKNWPVSSYGENPIPPDDKSGENRKIVACGTNWDLACRGPVDFHKGIQGVKGRSETFQFHRWDDWYGAVTEKYEIEHDEVMGKPYYFEIDWRPDTIVWRLGPSPDQMREMGYLDQSMSDIPNNQMVLIVTQEFHQEHWWPLEPYKQTAIPFPSKDIVGKIYDVVIE